MRHATDVHLEYLPGVPEQVVQVQDALGDLFRPAGEHHAAGLEVAGAGGRGRAGRPISAMPSRIMRSSKSR
jgi:hypothetical protein